MAKRISPRGLSTSQAAKKHLKSKKRKGKGKGKHVADEDEDKAASKFSRLDIWLITIATLVVLGFLIAMIVTQVG